jgi:uncharacterized OsmC-like protein
MAQRPKGRVDLDKMRTEYDKFRESAKAGENRGKINFRAVANILENVHLEGTVRGFRLECDEPEERGGTNLAPAPLSYFLIGAAFWLLTQIARFAHLYDVPIEDGKVDVRCTFDVSDKLDLPGSGAAFENVAFAIAIKSSAPDEQVKKLIAHAERGCHAEQSFRKPIAVTISATLNGKSLEIWIKELPWQNSWTSAIHSRNIKSQSPTAARFASHRSFLASTRFCFFIAAAGDLIAVGSWPITKRT